MFYKSQLKTSFNVAIRPLENEIIKVSFKNPMSEVKDNCKYAESHEWARLDEDGSVFVGITDYAQKSLGDITYIEMPMVGKVFSRGEVFGVVESVKAASDLYMPISGEILAVNPDVEPAPELVNDSPFEAGWMVHVKPINDSEFDDLLDAHSYKARFG